MQPGPHAQSCGTVPDSVEPQVDTGPPAVTSIRIVQRTIVPRLARPASAFVIWGHLPQWKGVEDKGEEDKPHFAVFFRLGSSHKIK